MSVSSVTWISTFFLFLLTLIIFLGNLVTFGCLPIFEWKLWLIILIRRCGFLLKLYNPVSRWAFLWCRVWQGRCGGDELDGRYCWEQVGKQADVKWATLKPALENCPPDYLIFFCNLLTFVELLCCSLNFTLLLVLHSEKSCLLKVKYFQPAKQNWK